MKNIELTLVLEYLHMKQQANSYETVCELFVICKRQN
jgi:hypothetical protein